MSQPTHATDARSYIREFAETDADEVTSSAVVKQVQSSFQDGAFDKNDLARLTSFLGDGIGPDAETLKDTPSAALEAHAASPINFLQQAVEIIASSDARGPGERMLLEQALRLTDNPEADQQAFLDKSRELLTNPDADATWDIDESNDGEGTMLRQLVDSLEDDADAQDKRLQSPIAQFVQLAYADGVLSDMELAGLKALASSGLATGKPVEKSDGQQSDPVINDSASDDDPYRDILRNLRLRDDEKGSVFDEIRDIALSHLDGGESTPGAARTSDADESESRGKKESAKVKAGADPDDQKATTTSPSSRPAAAPAQANMPAATGVVDVNETIVVRAGEVFDGGGKLFRAGAALGDGGQSESQKPVFKLEDGAVLRNVQISGADGVHAHGDATLKDVWWRDVGEDAFTKKAQGDVTVTGGGAFDASDKIFQLNAGGKFHLENFFADGFGKAVRTNGGKEMDTDITVVNSTFRNGKEAIVRTDANGARISLSGVDDGGIRNDALAPSASAVSGAHSYGSK